MSNIVNKEIVELINSNGANAIGISNNENKYIQVKKYISDKADYGYVGEITNIDTNYFCKLLDSNYIPVIAPLGFDENNNIYNINADSAASKIASELAAEKIIFLTDTRYLTAPSIHHQLECLFLSHYEQLGHITKQLVRQFQTGLLSFSKVVFQQPSQLSQRHSHHQTFQIEH